MKKITTLIIAGFMLMVAGLGVIMPKTAYADASTEAKRGTCAAQGGTFSTGPPVSCTVAGKGDVFDETTSGSLSNTIHTIVNVMLFIIGVLSVIMIIFGGIRFVISRGKSEDVKSARDTIMYSIVGLVVAVIAYAIVNWVFSTLAG